MGPQLKYLGEGHLISTHNICFHGKIKNIQIFFFEEEKQHLGASNKYPQHVIEKWRNKYLLLLCNKTACAKLADFHLCDIVRTPNEQVVPFCMESTTWRTSNKDPDQGPDVQNLTKLLANVTLNFYLEIRQIHWYILLKKCEHIFAAKISMYLKIP